MKTMRVVFRADASVAIGTGHVHRCLALAHALEATGAQISFVFRDLGIDVASLVGRYPHVALTAPLEPVPDCSLIAHAAWAGVEQVRDAVETIAVVEEATDWIVVDHYAFGAEWHDRVRAGTGARILAIDDLADRAMAADLIVDHTYWEGSGGKYDVVAPSTPSLVGPQYALLGPAYAQAQRYQFSEHVRSIGIFMGGVDAVGATNMVVDSLAGLSIPIEVATTRANPHLAELQARQDIGLRVDQPNLAAFFARHDLQIGAGGGASWERCCIAAPTLLLVMADNQHAVAGPLAKLGVVATTGDGFPYDPERIRSAVIKLVAAPALRRRLSAQSSNLVDGQGANRVTEVMKR